MSFAACLLIFCGLCCAASVQDRAPCAEVRQFYLAWQSQAGSSERLSGIAGQLAYDCLRSMPFRSDLAVRFIDEYSQYLQFHATLDFLKDPPKSYISTSVDLFKGIQGIRHKAADNLYSSQYEFDHELRYLISRANDGHLDLELCSLSIMHFEHTVPLVAISVDGLELPNIYTYFDAELMVSGASGISHVIRINGQDPTYFLQANIGVTVGLQDPDARYNSLFPSHTAGFEGRYSGGYWTNHFGLWPGPRQTLEFANGTSMVIETTASLSLRNFENVVDGDSLFQAACLPSSGGGHNDQPPILQTHLMDGIPSTGPSSYPSPVIRHKKDIIRGYYIDEDEHRDIAVLQLPTFKLDGEVPKGISSTAKEFIAQASAAGKKKLIIDLSGNGGGDVNVGFNLFRILFPSENIETRTRFRTTEIIRLMGKVFSSVQARDKYEQFPLDLPLAAHLAVTPDQKHAFGSWEELYGTGGDNEISVSEMYATFNFTSASTEIDPIEGYGPIIQTDSIQPFSADNIIIMTDGYCASTCTLLARLLQGQGVRSIVFGGRPRHAPMQLMGGVKGGQYWSLRTISRYIREAYEIAVQAARAGNDILTSDEMKRYRDIAPPATERFSLRFDTHGSSGVNFRNAYSKENVDSPLQFSFEPADCRLFFTAENYVQPATLWRAAAITMFGNGSCVPGSSVK